MPNKITCTGTVGPGKSVTSLVFDNVIDLDFQVDKKVLEIVYGTLFPRIAHLDYSGLTTVTYTISSGVATVTVS